MQANSAIWVQTLNANTHIYLKCICENILGILGMTGSVDVKHILGGKNPDKIKINENIYIYFVSV